jgi:hydrogenase maturation protease
MVEHAANRYAARLLCLGNDLLADDALGIRVAEELQGCLPQNVDVVASAESGLQLLDHLLGASRVVVIDTVQTGRADPGTIHELTEASFSPQLGASSHRLGLFDVLAVGRRMGMPAAETVTILAVEAADCRTLGGEMHPAVRDAIPRVIERALECLGIADAGVPQASSSSASHEYAAHGADGGPSAGRVP